MRTPALSTLVLVMACSGGSGADGDKKISDLSSDEVRAVCESSLEAQGGAGSVHDCGDGSTYTVGTFDECLAGLMDSASCELTVSEFEGCFADWSDPCQPPPPSCEALFTCVFNQS